MQAVGVNIRLPLEWRRSKAPVQRCQTPATNRPQSNDRKTVAFILGQRPNISQNDFLGRRSIVRPPLTAIGFFYGQRTPPSGAGGGVGVVKI